MNEVERRKEQLRRILTRIRSANDARALDKFLTALAETLSDAQVKAVVKAVDS